MQVLSLFDGISCGQIALNRIGITPEKYYAAEIDKQAIEVTKDNYPNTIHLGDVNKWYEWPIDWASIDLLIGGSPCQGFSFAGKQLAFDDPRSELFFVFLDILSFLKVVNPRVKFMLENVKMKKEHLDVITEKLGVEPVFINSSLVSAQSRQRYYWANWGFGTPADKNIKLADIIDDGFVGKDKSWCVLESWKRVTKKTEAAIGRYKRCMMPIVFTSNSLDFYEGWRELNISEVERLQTVPNGYCKALNGNKVKGLLGNGWTVDVIAHIFRAGLL